jgi:putative DNA primase/helicase
MSRPLRDELMRAALKYASDHGWHVLPLHSVDDHGGCTCGRDECASPGKHPRTKSGVKDASVSPRQIIAWWKQWPLANIGIACGEASGIDVVDVDPRHGGETSLAALGLPDGVAVITGSLGQHRYFRHREGTGNKVALAPGIDLRGTGGYVVAPPSWHKDGRRYEWRTAPVVNGALPPLPELPEKRRSPPPSVPRARAREAGPDHPYVAAAYRNEIDRVRNAPRGQRNDALNAAAFALGGFVAAGSLGENDVRASLYAAAEDLVATDGDKSVIATIESGLKGGLAHAREVPEPRPKPNGKGNGHGGNGHVAPPHDADGVINETRAETRSPAGSEDALALEFARQHALDWRYVANWGRWMSWRGDRWCFDDRMQCRELVRTICRAAAAVLPDKKQATAKAITSNKTVAAVEHLARSDARIAMSADQWDCDPWLLATPGGCVDLRTGATRPAARSDFLTKRATATPSGDCPLWLRFLSRVTGGDLPLMQFLQRLAGYALTGITREHALFFLYGTGTNGKGTFINTLTGILGDYATVAGMDTFIATPGEKHSTDLAMLRGARLVSAQETEEGRRWAEAKLKALTGGDPITARFMRQDNFTFIPQFKLVIAGNHKPALRNIDPAMRRRFHLVPFTQTIPESEVDRHFPEKLRAEWGGILKWAVDGCRAWLDKGLLAPPSVRKATDEYFVGEDSFSRWIEECCVIKPTQSDTSAALWQSWSAWCERNGEYAGSQRVLSEKLIAKGFTPTRDNKARGFSGIGVIRDAPSYAEPGGYDR